MAPQRIADPFGGEFVSPDAVKAAPYKFEYPEDEKAAAAAAAAEAAPAKRDAIAAGWEAAKTNLLTGVPYAVRRAFGELPEADQNEYLRRFQESAAKQEKLLPGGALGLEGVKDVPTFGQFVAEQLGYSTPNLVAGIGGAAAGGVAGSLVAPGPGTLAGAVGGFAGGVGLNTPLYIGSNVAAATEQGQKPLTETGAQRSIGVAPLQAVGDQAEQLLLPGVGKLGLGKYVRPLVQSQGGLITRGVKGVAKGALIGGPTEAGQQVGEQYASERDLLSPEALEETKRAGLAGAVLEGTIGGVASPFSGKEGRKPPTPVTTEEEKDKTQNLPEEGGELATPAQAGELATPAVAGELATPTAAGELTSAPTETAPINQRPQTQRWRNAIGSIESGNDYTRRGPVIKEGRYWGQRAMGRYQIMPGNLPEWSKAALGYEITEDQFMANPRLQDAIFDHRFNDHVRQFGSPDDAASAWLTGKSLANAGEASDQLGTNARKYVAKFRKFGGSSGDYDASGVNTFGSEETAEVPGGADTADTIMSEAGALIRELMAASAEPGEAVDENAPASQQAVKLANSIASGGEDAVAALREEREEIARQYRLLQLNEEGLAAEQVAAQEATLARRERVLAAAMDAAARVAEQRGVQLVTQPRPLDVANLPGGPREPDPDSARLGEALASEQARIEANEKSPTVQREKKVVERRARLLDKVIDEKGPDPRARYMAILNQLKMDPTLSDDENAVLEDVEAFMPPPAAPIPERAAAETGAPVETVAAPEQIGPTAEEAVAAGPAIIASPVDTTEDVNLGVRERPAPAPAPVAEPEPIAPEPEREVQKSPDETLKEQGEAFFDSQNPGKPVRMKWFKEGMKAALGEDYEAPKTTKGGQTNNFNAGKAFVERVQRRRVKRAKIDEVREKLASRREAIQLNRRAAEDLQDEKRSLKPIAARQPKYGWRKRQAEEARARIAEIDKLLADIPNNWLKKPTEPVVETPAKTVLRKASTAKKEGTPKPEQTEATKAAITAKKPTPASAAKPEPKAAKPTPSLTPKVVGEPKRRKNSDGFMEHVVQLDDGTEVVLTRDTDQFGKGNPQWSVDDPHSKDASGADYEGSLGWNLETALEALPSRLARGRARKQAAATKPKPKGAITVERIMEARANLKKKGEVERVETLDEDETNETDDDKARRAFLVTVGGARARGQISPLEANRLIAMTNATYDAGGSIGVISSVPTKDLPALLTNAIGGVKAQATGPGVNVTRRGFAGVLAGLSLAANQASARTSVSNNDAVTKALEKGDVQGVIQAIAATSKNPLYRELARMMSLGGFAKNATIEVWDMGDAKLNLLGITNVGSGQIKIFTSTAPDSNGLTEETILHEALHSWLAARYGAMEIYSIMLNPENKAAYPELQTQQGKEFVQNFLKLHNKFKEMMRKKFPEKMQKPEQGIDDDAAFDAFDWPMYFAAMDPDEFFARMFTEPKLQDWLRTHDANGNTVKPVNPASFWQKLLAMIRDLFGIAPPSPNLLNAAMDAGWSVIKSGTLDAPNQAKSASSDNFAAYGRDDGGRRMFKQGQPEKVKISEAAPAGAIGLGTNLKAAATGGGTGVKASARAAKNTPKAYARRTATQRASTAVKVSGEEIVKKGHLWLTGTEDIANMMGRYTKWARKVVELHSNAHALGRKYEERLIEIKDRYHALPSKLRGTKPGSVSEFLYDMTMSKKWGFKPPYHDEAIIEMDPDLVKRFEAMPKEAQQVIKDVFKYNHDSRDELFEATKTAINAEYDPLLAVATTDAQRERITADKTRALAHSSRVFDTQAGVPYTPTKREGWWVVVGKSKAYRDAVEAKDQKLIDKLSKSSAHYFVDFRDTAAEAEALHSHVFQKFGEEGSYYFERSKVPDGAIDSDEIYLAMDQLKQAIAGEAKKGSRTAQRMERLVTDLYLHSLSETSARKAELHRKGVPAKDEMTGEVLDMMQAFVSRGTATASYIASIDNAPQMHAALRGMNEDLKKVPYAERRAAQRMHNEMMYRYTANLGVKPNRAVDRMVRTVSIWTLLSSPFYYLQNMSQAGLISLPVLASKYGYAKAWSMMLEGYADFNVMTKGTGVLDRMDYSKAPDGPDKSNPDEYRNLLKKLAERGRLDAGYSMELGKWELDGDGAVAMWGNKLDKFLRMMPQRIEVQNRVVTGLAAYKAARAANLSPEAAFEEASKLIYDTHGDYSAFNSPRPFTVLGNVGKVTLQFRKFQLIMGGLIGKEFHRAFLKGEATREERVQGIKALAFLSAHMAAIGGIMAQPGAALLGPIIGTILNLLDPEDDEEYSNWQEDLRKALGAGGEGSKRDWLADLLYKGAPYALLSMDTSDRLGMGNIAALAPYTDLPEGLSSKEKMFEIIGKIALGPSGGMLAKANDAWGFGMVQKDWTRAMETMMPGALGNTMKAARLATDGLTTKQGDVLVQPEDLQGEKAIYTAIGVRPRTLANQAERRSVDFAKREHYEGITTQLKNEFTRAAKEGDAPTKARVLARWAEVQKARERQGFAKQPIRDLKKAPGAQLKRERQVIGGVPTTKANRMSVVDMMFAETPEEALALVGAN